MSFLTWTRSAWTQRHLLLGVALAAGLSTGCLAPHCYLDPATKEVPKSEFKAAEHPKPVHLVFEFQTKGAPNAGATTSLAGEVKQAVKDSGLFADVDAPAGPEVALLSITLNNVPITNEGDAVSKGFLTGLTFGLAGTAVTDGYVCTLSYLGPGMTKPIVETARHAIHTTIGNASPPSGAIQTSNPKEAGTTMTRQVVSHVLNDLSHDPAF